MKVIQSNLCIELGFQIGWFQINLSRWMTFVFTLIWCFKPKWPHSAMQLKSIFRSHHQFEWNCLDSLPSDSGLSNVLQIFWHFVVYLAFGLTCRQVLARLESSLQTRMKPSRTVDCKLLWEDVNYFYSLRQCYPWQQKCWQNAR